MSPGVNEYELWDRIGQMTSSIESSRNDSNNRFSMLISTVTENKKDVDSFKKEMLKEMGTIKEYMAQIKVWGGILFFVLNPAIILAMIQILGLIK